MKDNNVETGIVIVVCIVAFSLLFFLFGFKTEDKLISLDEIYITLDNECIDACIDLRDNPRNYYEPIYRYHNQIKAFKVHVDKGDNNPLNDKCFCRLNVDSFLAFDREYRLDTNFEVVK